MESNVTEIRNAKGKLIAKWYPDEGVIEIIIKGCRSILTVPPGTPIQFDPGTLLIKQAMKIAKI